MGGPRGIAQHERCWSVDCLGTVAVRPASKFFRFPRDPVRCREWVKRAGNIMLASNTIKQLTNKALCNKHFSHDQFKIPGNVESRLVPKAVPSIFISSSLPDGCLPAVLPADIDLPKPTRSQVRHLNAVKVPKPPALNVSVGEGQSSISVHCVSPPREGPGPAVSRSSEKRRPLASIENTLSKSGGKSTGKRTALASSTTFQSIKRRRLDFDGSFAVTSTPATKSAPGPSRGFASPVWSSPVWPATPSGSVPFCPQNASLVVSDSSLDVNPGSSSDCASSIRTAIDNTTTPVQSSQVSEPSLAGPRSEKSRRATVRSLYNIKKSSGSPDLQKALRDNMFMRRKISRIQKTLQAVRDHRGALLRAANSPAVGDLARQMRTREGAILFGAQFRNAGRRKKGRRWTLEEKTVSLSLWRGAKKNYNLLRKILDLPGPSTLADFMTRLHFDVGENAHYFEHLAKVVRKFRPRDRACSVMWDETQVKKFLKYNEKKDKVEGFQDYGDGVDGRDKTDKCLVFMVQSLSKKWKQPVAYYFAQDEVPAKTLVRLIVAVISHLQEAGFDVRATVCDQGGNNRKAVAALQRKFQPPRPARVPLCSACKLRKKSCQGPFSRADCRECRINSIRPTVNPYFRINNDTNIWHFWDPPHLIKNLRNSFIITT